MFYPYKRTFLFIFVFLFSFVLAPDVSWSQNPKPTCEKLLLERAFELDAKLNSYRFKIGTLNTQVFLLGKPEKKLNKHRKPITINTSPSAKAKAIAKAIRELDLDVVVLQEVFGSDTLSIFTTQYLKNYNYLIADGNDQMGSRIAFLIKQLPFEAKLKSNRSFRFRECSRRVFQRDFPVLQIKTPWLESTEKIILQVGGVHLKSQKDRYSYEVQKREIKAASILIENTSSESPFVLAGDFNANLIDDGVFLPFFTWNKLGDVFDLTGQEKKVRLTTNDYRQFDGILVSKTLHHSVLSANTVRVFTKDRKPVSDHKLVYTEVTVPLPNLHTLSEFDSPEESNVSIYAKAFRQRNRTKTIDKHKPQHPMH